MAGLQLAFNMTYTNKALSEQRAVIKFILVKIGTDINIHRHLQNIYAYLAMDKITATVRKRKREAV